MAAALVLCPSAFVTAVEGRGVTTLSGAVVFILQALPSGHPSFLSLQAESPSLPQALRTCTGWRRSSGAPAMPSPLLSPATLTTASRIQCSRDELRWVPRTVSRSLSVPPWCWDTARSTKALLGQVECLLTSHFSPLLLHRVPYELA